MVSRRSKAKDQAISSGSSILEDELKVSSRGKAKRVTTAVASSSKLQPPVDPLNPHHQSKRQKTCEEELKKEEGKRAVNEDAETAKKMGKNHGKVRQDAGQDDNGLIWV